MAQRLVPLQLSPVLAKTYVAVATAGGNSRSRRTTSLKTVLHWGHSKARTSRRPAAGDMLISSRLTLHKMQCAAASMGLSLRLVRMHPTLRRVIKASVNLRGVRRAASNRGLDALANAIDHVG